MSPIEEITVLMPVYNAEPYICDAVKSILNQTFKYFELIIIDDGSTDNSESLVNSLNDSRINYFKIEHKGLSSALNYGIKISKADIIARMDADDIANRNRLEIQYDFITRNKDIDIVSSNYSIINEKGKIIYNVQVPEKDIEIKRALLINSVVPHPCVIYRKSIFERNGYYNENLLTAMDYELWLRCINNSCFHNIQMPLLQKRVGKKSMTGNVKLLKYDREITIQIMTDFLKDNKLPPEINLNHVEKSQFMFKLRYGNKINLKNILTSHSITTNQKIVFTLFSLIPFKLRLFYFIINPKLRLKYKLNKLSALLGTLICRLET